MSELSGDSSFFTLQGDGVCDAAEAPPAVEPTRFQRSSDEGDACLEDALSEQELRESARAQLEEIARYQWYLGERLGRDPLLDRTREDIALEWIALYAADFRREWERIRRGR